MNPQQIEENYLTLQDHCNVREQLNPNDLAEWIKTKEEIITFNDTQESFYYNKNTGLYENAEMLIDQIVQFVAKWKTKTHLINEVKASIARQTYVKRELIEGNLNLIPLENMVYNIDNNELIDYSPKHYFFTKHPIDLKQEDLQQEEVVINPISKWITNIVETQENEVMLKEMIGYCFYREVPFQNFFLLVGSGANGKSVLLNIIHKMLGHKNVSGVSLQQLADSNNRFSVGNLYLKNANVFGDLPSKALEDVGLLKQLTGNDILTCDRKFKESFSFRNYAKIIASCNAIPETNEYSDAFFRRPIIVKFPYNFEGEGEDRQLFEKLSTPENLKGFFLECIQAFKYALNENQFIKKETTETKKKNYLQYSNSAKSFCEDYLEYDPESELQSHVIFDNYSKYCKNHKLILKDERQFFINLYKAFGNRVYKKRKRDGSMRYYVVVGIDWKGDSLPALTL